MATNKHDITGQRFGRLTARERAGKNADGKTLWLCDCECGVEKVAILGKLRGGRVRSCGCLQREKQAAFGSKGVAKAVAEPKPRGKVETVDEYLARGGRINRVENGQWPDAGRIVMSEWAKKRQRLAAMEVR